MLPKKLISKLQKRCDENTFRQLGNANHLIDFSSNDYLGFSKNEDLYNNANNLLTSKNIIQNGATGSRLLSGNHRLYNDVEALLCKAHNSEDSLIFNSGYTANLGFFSCVPQRGDIVLYDEFIHASIRDGITMSHAKSYKFKHNDLKDVEQQILRYHKNDTLIYVVTESVFSMDGDTPDLKLLSKLCNTYKVNLIVDEAHAIGVFGKSGTGKIQELHLEEDVFARIITFGKALGSHGAAILCHKDLKDYLINFSRPFIYTTALPPHALATIKTSYDRMLNQTQSDLIKLQDNIKFFKLELERLKLQPLFTESNSAIHCCIISGHKTIKHIAQELQNHGFDVKAILSPTVPNGKERLRFCIHSYNSSEEITKVLELLATFV